MSPECADTETRQAFQDLQRSALQRDRSVTRWSSSHEGLAAFFKSWGRWLSRSRSEGHKACNTCKRVPEELESKRSERASSLIPVSSTLRVKYLPSLSNVSGTRLAKMASTAKLIKTAKMIKMANASLTGLKRNIKNNAGRRRL